MGQHRHPLQQRRRVHDPERTADHSADRHHSARDIIDPGSSMDPGKLPCERPHERRRKHLREYHRSIPPQAHLRKRRHAQRKRRRAQCVEGSQQLRPVIEATTAEQQQCAREQENKRQQPWQCKLLVKIPVPRPRDRHQRYRRVERRHGDERTKREARKRRAGLIARVRGGQGSPASVRAEYGRQRAQVVERTALRWLRCTSRPIPVHLLVRRDGVRDVDQHPAVRHAASPQSPRSGDIPAR